MKNLFNKYIQGNCTREEYKRVIEFIQKPENDLYINGLLLNNWKNILNNESTITPNQKILDSVHHQIALKETSTSQKTIKLYRGLLTTAAVLLIGLIIGSVFYVQSQIPEVTTQSINTPYGGKTHFSLPDGSIVWLNSGTTFSYPDRFEDERIVELDGEAYFEVEKQKEPFIVKTSFGKVEVLGTSFNVKAYKEEIFETTLESGSVVYTNPAGRKAVLKPGSQVVYSSDKCFIQQVETEIYTSWKDGKLIFRNEPLQNIITSLERWYNVDIKLEDERIKNLKYTGTIEMESFSEILELIKATTPIEYSFDRNSRVLTISAPKN
ncbi:MAG: FecR family protein [Bacteroidota bacterium]